MNAPVSLVFGMFEQAKSLLAIDDVLRTDNRRVLGVHFRSPSPGPGSTAFLCGKRYTNVNDPGTQIFAKRDADSGDKLFRCSGGTRPAATEAANAARWHDASVLDAHPAVQFPKAI